MRIVKAIQAGEDPNASNPVQEVAADSDEMQLDQNDPEVQRINDPSSVPEQRPRQASVEEVPDEQDRIQARLATTSSLNESLHPSRSSSIRRRPGQTRSPALVPTPPGEASNPRDFYTAPEAGSDVSPLESPTIRSETSARSGYFHNDDVPTRSANIEHVQPYISPGVKSQYFLPSQAGEGPRGVMDTQPPLPSNPTAEDNFIDNEEAILKAQKHARWAISALNFEDVKTAVKELRGALETLGAR